MIMKMYKKPQTEVYSVITEDIMQVPVISGAGKSSGSQDPIDGD